MKIMMRHVVTKASDDSTFEVGDHISFYDDGSIGCVEARGWIDKEDVEAAIRGMQSDIDLEWYAKKKKALQKQLDALSSVVD